MIIYLFDGTFKGLLTCVFESFKHKETPFQVSGTSITPPFFATVKNIETNEDKANRVDLKLKKILKGFSYSRILYAFSCNEPNSSHVVFSFIVKIITSDKDISENFLDKDIYKFKEIADKVKMEVHRFKGLIRFEQTVYGIYYAKFSPDNNICEFLLPHFKNRFSQMPFVIHDIKRGIYACYNNGEQKIVHNSNNFNDFFKSNDEFKKLFKKYYDSVNIKQRKNLKQMYNYMPKRYHTYLPEKDVLLNLSDN